MRAPCLLLLALWTLAIVPHGADAQIRRCVTPDGGHVYTDRACKDIGASERPARTGVVQQGGRVIRRDCSRNVQDLVHELTAAIDQRDVNRLAGIYHWPGTSTRGAHAIMGRLDTIVNRPLVDITPLQPPTLPAMPTGATAPASNLAWQTAPAQARAQNPTAAATPEGAELPDSVRWAAARQRQGQRAPTALLVDQTVANRITPLQTVFSLRRHLDCWWVSL